jgi:hypothetical protein
VSVGGVGSWQQSASQTTASVTVGSGAGSYDASVWERDQAGNQAGAQTIPLRYDPDAPSPPSLGPARPTWLGSSQLSQPESLNSIAGGPSGVYGYQVAIDGMPTGGWQQANSSGLFDISQLTDGVHQLCAVAFSGAGVQSPEACTTLQIDRQAPSTSVSSDTPQASTSWVNHPVVLTINCSDAIAGCQSVSYSLDGGPAQTINGSSAQVTVSASGQHTLDAWSTNNAGNSSSPGGEQALVDTSTPQGAFEPTNPNNPQQLTVDVADAYSGVATGQIQLDVDGGWTSLPTRYDSAGHLSAIASDDQFPRGSWAVRALVSSAAGTTATITNYPDGTAVTHAIPARLQTILHVGRATIDIRVCHARLVRVKARLAHRRRAQNQHPVARLRRICDVRHVPAAGVPVRLSAPRALTVSGELDSTLGQPLSGQWVQVVFTANGWTAQQLGWVRTDTHGRFTYRLPAGGSGTVSLAFPGTSLLGDSRSQLAVKVRGQILASVTIRAGGQRSILSMSGQVLGGYIPPGGVEIQPEYIELGQPALVWAPFGPPIYTNAHGHWSRNIQVATQAHGHAYLLRFVANRQAEWPFEPTASRVFNRTL